MTGIPRSPRRDRRDKQAGAQAARDALARALLRLADRDQEPPCRGDDRFVADDVAVLQEAATACQLCPIRRECRAAGEHESAGVWGGVVVGQAHGRQGRPRRKEPA